IDGLNYVYQLQWVQTMIYVATAIWNFGSPVVQVIFGIITAANATSLWANVLSLILEITIIWIVFLVQALTSGFAGGSIAFNVILNTAIHATIAAILTFVFLAVLVAVFSLGAGLFLSTIVLALIGVADAFGYFFDFSVTDWLNQQMTPLKKGGTLRTHASTV
ncbi:MAG: hypothetical protein GY833_13305, partial [Aestuariibacter sp.]|nr:hypothetical protein [Aestuariibacter sp.]